MPQLTRWEMVCLTTSTCKYLASGYLVQGIQADPTSDTSVRREDARDLRTIRETLQRSKEGVTLESLDADIYQMLQNARKFNPEGSLVHEAAIDVGKRWDQLRAEIEMGRRGQYWAPGDREGSRGRR